jgi:hypothetical protein
VDVPEADVGALEGTVDGGHGVEGALGDLVEGDVAVGQAEQVAAAQGAEFVGAVADAPVRGVQGPAAPAALGDPFCVADLLCIAG